MGTNVPDDRQSQVLTWFDGRLPLWAEDPARLGLTEERVAEVQAAYDEARAAHNAARAAHAAARNATADSRVALARLSSIGRGAVQTIKAYVASAEDPDLWGDAGLSRPDRRGTLPLPVAPGTITFSILETGAVRLAWKVKQPKGVRGVVYSVLRGLNGERPTLLRTVGEKFFIDDTLPVGFPRALYAIQPRRGMHEGQTSRIIEITPGTQAPRARAAPAAQQAA